MSRSLSFFENLLQQYKKHHLGLGAFYVVLLFALVGVYAPFLASSKPLIAWYDGKWYFPLWRYLFFQGFYTKSVDIFYNLLMFTFPLFLGIYLKKPSKLLFSFTLALFLQLFLFFLLQFYPLRDPSVDLSLNFEKQAFLKEKKGRLSWEEKLSFMAPYEKLNRLLRHRLRKDQDRQLQQYALEGESLPTLWQLERAYVEKKLKEQKDIELDYLQDKQAWLNQEEEKLAWVIFPFISRFHWEEDAGGQQALNRRLPFWHLTRINQKDLAASLIFGIRISLMVGVLAVSLQLLIGIPIGAMAGFWGGKVDIVISRLLEVWEGLPTFFMLLMVVAVMQSKSIFLVVTVLGIFGWTGMSRFIRGEVLKQRNLPYVEALRCCGFSSLSILFKHVLPNAIPPILTLLPFAVMGAISSEAGLSFLGLGEEGSCSWGVLMDEGRLAFPGESYLLWPPAILLTVLLVAIALIGDALRDAIDPKMHRV